MQYLALPNLIVVLSGALFASVAASQVRTRVVDIPTRPGVTQRFLYLAPEQPKAAIIIYAGGHGGLRISQAGKLGWGEGNFLVRSRALFSEQGFAVAVLDAPSDRQDLNRFRQTAQHTEDTRAVIAWLREQTGAPVWLVGTSNGTLSAAFIATQLPRAQGGPDGLVLTSTILLNVSGATRPVPEMALGRISVPVLVVHHKKDGCSACPFSEVPRLMTKLNGSPRSGLLSFEGGIDAGDPCEAFAHHGFNGIERDVVNGISERIVKP